jgi:hypothetical protein
MRFICLFSFDELVSRARIKDRAEKDLGEERARGLVSMVIERRRFLKKRAKEEKKNQMMRRKENSMSVVGNWLVPTSKPISPSSREMRRENGTFDATGKL